MRIEKLLMETALIPSLSGYEQKMAQYMKKKFEENDLPVKIDVFGNCIAKVEGKNPSAPSVMVFGHMDQLGFMVRYIEPDGFIRLERVGGIPEKVLPALDVQIQNRKGEMIDGVIGVKSHHATPAEEKYIVEKYTSLFVDVGAANREQVEKMGITIGCPVVYTPKFKKLAGTVVSGTSLDNRIACAIVMELAYRFREHKPENTVYLVGTVQEEFNLRGAMVAARTTKPDVAICIDIALEGKTPDMKNMNDVAMGDGPVLSLYNFHGRGTLNGTIPHPDMVRIFEQAAQKKGINLQRLALIGSLTDMAYLQFEGTGVRGVDIGVPCRYTHTPVETCDIKDLESTTQLIFEAINNLNSLQL
ncbi:M42 family metallopeptidase [Tepidanaerobacter acetatoxydans]|uniref:M42 family metallopeptidase n=1 Tax=Tepidanaerobacter acetatoxydans TaxID=499229 RepID=UPI001BD69B75|nr:M20/M25/M40 family metallo-hydrolase [Tepidanaerobacter acetatoxydans]